MNAVTPFAYDDAEQRIVVEQRFTEAQDLMRQGLWSLTQAGGKYAEIRDRLAHNRAGGFEGWLEGKGLSRRSIYRMIDMHASFGNCANLAQLDIDKSAAYLLSAPSTPEPARQEAVQRAATGERVTVAKAKAIIDVHRPAPSTSKPALPAPAASDTAALLPILEDWLTVFKTDRQRELALQDAIRNGSLYQPALRVRLPLETRKQDIQQAARSLRGQPTPDVAPVEVNGAAAGRPTPAAVRPAPAQPVARDLSLDELRAALLELLTLPHSATNADILAAVGTLQAVYEVSRE